MQAQISLPFPPPCDPDSSSSGLTEIHLPSFSSENLDMVLPMLAHLSRQAKPGKWFSWIAPKSITKHLLLEYGFNVNCVQLIHTKCKEDTLWAMWELLTKEHSDVVIANCSSISNKEYKLLSEAAFTGSSRGLLLSGSKTNPF